MTLVVRADEETHPEVLRELYLLPFEMAVKDGETGAVMCSYNALNGAFACENAEMLSDIQVEVAAGESVTVLASNVISAERWLETQGH